MAVLLLPAQPRAAGLPPSPPSPPSGSPSLDIAIARALGRRGETEWGLLLRSALLLLHLFLQFFGTAGMREAFVLETSKVFGMGRGCNFGSQKMMPVSASVLLDSGTGGKKE